MLLWLKIVVICSHLEPITLIILSSVGQREGQDADKVQVGELKASCGGEEWSRGLVLSLLT